MAYGDERETNGLTPMTGETPRTGGNPQGISDSVATPPNGGTQTDAQGVNGAGGTGTGANLKPTETATGGILSRLANAPALATPNAPTMATLTPNAPTATQGTTQRTATQAPFSPAPNQGLVQSYFDKLTGKTPQDTARTEQYRQMFEAARRGAARNPADGYNAQREQALKTAMGQAVRQNAPAQTQTASPAPSAPTVRQNADGSRSAIGMVNGEEVDYGDVSPAEAARMQETVAGVQGLMDEFYGNDLDFMTNV